MTEGWEGTVTRVQGGSSPTMTYTYDANGNMLTKQEQGGSLTEYRYDIENRLLDVKKDGAFVSEFKYDGDGGRTRKITANEDIRFVGSLYEEANNRASSYVFLGSTRIAQINDGQVFYYLTDHLGGTNVLTDSQGVKKQILEYLPYGKITRDEKFGTTAEQDAWYHFTGQYNDKESELYFFNARYYDPELGRFIQADEIVSKAGIPITLNRYAYAGNNPIMNIDPSGHFFGFIFAAIKAIVSFAIAHPVIAGAVVGGISGGISAGSMGGNILQGIALGGLQGGAAGFTLGLSPGSPGIGAGLGILKTSAAVGLTSQVIDAVGEEGVAQGLRYASMALGAAYTGLNVGVGIKDWAVGELSVTDLTGNAASIQSGDNIYVNGICTDLDSAKAQAAHFNKRYGVGINKIAHNSPHGAIANLTESFLQKITFTSSVDRQLANIVKGLNGITFVGHSQGTLITGNALLNLGFSDNRTVIRNSINFSSPLSQPRAFISAAIGGTGGKVFYGNNWGDPINLVGPNINPVKLLSGLTFQFQNH